MRPAKQQRQSALRNLAAGTRVSEQSLSKILSKLTKDPSLQEDLGTSSSSTLRHDFGSMAAGLMEHLGTDVLLPLDNGGQHILKIATPQSVLAHFVSKSPAFKDIMQKKIREHPFPWRMILYHDDIAGGNVYFALIIVGRFVQFTFLL